MPSLPNPHMTRDNDLSTANVERKLLDQIDSLRKEDERLYNILAIDICALAKTLDE